MLVNNLAALELWQSLAPDDKMPRILVMELPEDHKNAVVRAVSNVLKTQVAEFTYAQILDGLPTIETYRDRRYGNLHSDHPLHLHTELCLGVLQKIQRYRWRFDPGTLVLDVKLADAFRAARIGSREFRLRLVEITAVAVHEIAVYLFKLDASLHKDDGVTSWMPNHDDCDEKTKEALKLCRVILPPLTFFTHCAYRCKDKYPNGVADMVGYWAENMIFGGVVLFGRGRSGFKCKDIYFHSDRRQVTALIFKLLDSQVDELFRFLSGSGEDCPLPIFGKYANEVRVEPDDAIDRHHIFRDRWEREIPVRNGEYFRNRSCIKHYIDYPKLLARSNFPIPPDREN